MTLPRELVLGTAGHIDHGKTALVRVLTGINTDRLPAERQRGITIDLGFAYLDLGSCRLAIVDVPGHERFIRNMLAGATGLDLALLVVAADDSVMPQTREHLEILQLLGLTGGLVALSKCDLVDREWLGLVEDEVRAYVAGSFLEGAPIIRTSVQTGEGLEELKSALRRVVESAPARSDPGMFRLAVDRSFTVPGHGTVVTGTIASGQVAVGDELEWLPEGRDVRIRGIQQHDRPVERLSRGARAAINLAGVHHTEIHRGQELGAPGYLKPTQVLSVEVHRSEGALRPLKHRGRYRLHLGTAEVSATLALLDPTAELNETSTLAQLFLSEPVAAVHSQPFVLREESPPATLGGGRVLHPTLRRLRRRDLSAMARLTRLRDDRPTERVRAVLAFQGIRPWTATDLVRDAGLSLAEVAPAVAQLETEGALVELPLGPRRTVRVLAEVCEELEDRVLRALGRLHAARPRQSALRRAHVIAELPDLPNETLVAGVIERLLSQGKVVADARTVALKGFEPKLSQAERRLKTELADALRAGGLTPPDLPNLAALAGARASVVPELIQLLIDEGQVVELGHQLYLATDADAELRRRVSDRLADGSGMTMAELRDLLNTTRKYAVPIGEYLDRIGVTRREGDVRRAADRISPG
jgi:selenocysteine-specific elongation factor